MSVVEKLRTYFAASVVDISLSEISEGAGVPGCCSCVFVPHPIRVRAMKMESVIE
jgi:hypothetical protein